MLKIISLGFSIQSQEVLNTSFDGHFSLLDADIVLIEPARLYEAMQKVAGSGVLEGLFNRRRKEIQTLLANGKVVISFLSPKGGVTVASGRNTHISLTNYSWMHHTLVDFIVGSVAPGTGTAISLKIPQHPFAPYFNAFREKLTYAEYLENDPPAESGQCYLVNKAGKTVGLSFRVGSGLIVFVPYLLEGKLEAEKIVGVLIQCVRPILAKSDRTAPPDWTKDHLVPGEDTILHDVTAIEARIKQEEDRLTAARENLTSLTAYRDLLYEKGKPLEEIVLKAFALMGFKAERLQKGDLEHDVILSSPEGRGIVEVEGRDDEAIHIDKLDHLTRVVDEDFHENSEYAHGILVGNPYRMKSPIERQAPFTDKVLVSAERKGFGLLTTVELFQAVTKMLKNPDDENLKTRYRQIMLQSCGKVIRFD